MSDKSRLNRRQFLKGAMAAGAVVGFPTIIPSTLGKDGAVAPSNRIVMGFIGVGSQGTSNMRGFLEHAQAHVIAVCDVDADNAKQAKEIVDGKYKNSDCKIFKDYRAMIAKGQIDAVAIAVPDHWHALTAVAAAQAGLDIYGEKPLARSIREARAIVRAVQRHGRVWQTGSWQRSRQEFYQAAMLARNGRIGKIKYVEVGLPDGGSTRVSPVDAAAPAGLDWEFWLGPAPYTPVLPVQPGQPRQALPLGLALDHGLLGRADDRLVRPSHRHRPLGSGHRLHRAGQDRGQGRLSDRGDLERADGVTTSR